MKQPSGRKAGEGRTGKGRPAKSGERTKTGVSTTRQAEEAAIGLFKMIFFGAACPPSPPKGRKAD